MKHYIYQGKSYTITQLAELAAKRFDNPLKSQTIYARLNRSSWDIERALKTPAEPNSLKDLTPAQRRRRLSKQQQNYFKRHRETFYRSNYLAMVKTYLRKYATADELREALARVQDKNAEVKDEAKVNA